MTTPGHIHWAANTSIKTCCVRNWDEKAFSRGRSPPTLPVESSSARVLKKEKRGMTTSVMCIGAYLPYIHKQVFHCLHTLLRRYVKVRQGEAGVYHNAIWRL